LVRELVIKSRIAVAEARGQFGKPQEGERPPLVAVTRGLAETVTGETGVSVYVYVTVICNV
jgi:hypothetical protein